MGFHSRPWSRKIASVDLKGESVTDRNGFALVFVKLCLNYKRILWGSWGKVCGGLVACVFQGIDALLKGNFVKSKKKIFGLKETKSLFESW